MAETKYDVIVIGGGPGGYVAAIRCGQLGLKTLCIEKGNTLGGTCLNVGCIPSKALLQSSEAYAWIRQQAAEHGLLVSDLKLDWEKMQERKKQVVHSLVSGIPALLKKNHADYVTGTAQFVSPTTIQVGEQMYSAPHLILATGSESVQLPFLPFDGKVIISSTEALSLPHVPKKMLVIGAGVIGVELASVYKRLGTEVVIVEMLDTITPAMDAAVSRALLQILKKQGLVFHLGAKVIGGKVEKDQAHIHVIIEGKENEFVVDTVLVAVGRRPYTTGLSLEKAGLKPNAKGFIEVNSHFATAVPGIYAIGDLIEGPMLAHRAMEEGMVLAEHLAGHPASIHYMGIPNVIYTHPEVASVGLTEAEARTAHLELLMGTSFFKGNGRARCVGDTDGFVKVIGEKKSGRLIGMHIIGPHASELIGEGVVAIDSHRTVEQLANSSHAHPTLAETIKEACLQALGRPLHG